MKRGSYHFHDFLKICACKTASKALSIRGVHIRVFVKLTFTYCATTSQNMRYSLTSIHHRLLLLVFQGSSCSHIASPSSPLCLLTFVIVFGVRYVFFVEQFVRTEAISLRTLLCSLQCSEHTGTCRSCSFFTVLRCPFPDPVIPTSLVL